MSFEPVPADHPAFAMVDRLTRESFEQGMTDIKRGRLRVSKETKKTLQVIAHCMRSFPREGASAFSQQGAAILAQVKEGTRQ